MIVRSLHEIVDTPRTVSGDTWMSRRLLLAEDGMGFSMHDTILHANTETHMCYTNHLEAVYCIEGEGHVECVDDGTRHPLSPGTLYALNDHDRHILRTTTRMRMICVFNPPCTGQEVHDADGAYPAAQLEPAS